jgi:DNA (cytosine-5)-methyltransferase 1
VWGTYTSAITRWEHVLGRPAPAPTEPGKTGQRLSPRFVEWMMGLPAGWVCDVPDLTRGEQLKTLGNGVVPQQAAAALRLLLTHTPASVHARTGAPAGPVTAEETA